MTYCCHGPKLNQKQYQTQKTLVPSYIQAFIILRYLHNSHAQWAGTGNKRKK